MEVRIESEEPRDRDPRAGKRRRPNGPTVPSPATGVDQTGRVLIEREAEWLARWVNDPASFAVIEREIHEHARRQADLYVAGLLAQASESPETARHLDQVIASAAVPLPPVENKGVPGSCASWAAWRSR
jgi:hypothetical protein